jgi:hypothetical protein
MTRASNPITSKTEAAARANYEADGLCFVCGMPETGCLHVTVAHMMAPDAWAAFAATNPTYDQLRDKRLELANALEARRPVRGDVVRFDRGRGTDSLPAKGR